MTHTSEHDSQKHCINGPDVVPHKKPAAKPAKQPTRGRSIVGDFPIFVSEVQSAIRAVEQNSTVLALKKAYESTELSRASRVAYNAAQMLNDSEFGRGVRLVQHLSQSAADEVRRITNEYRH